MKSLFFSSAISKNRSEVVEECGGGEARGDAASQGLAGPSEDATPMKVVILTGGALLRRARRKVKM